MTRIRKAALTARVSKARDYDEPRDSLAHDWIATLEDWGLLPVLIFNTLHDPAGYLDVMDVDILILTGGENVGESPERDRTETALLEHALARRLPVLGVCRGLQLINHHFGGELVPVTSHVAAPHSVRVALAWQAHYGAETRVNSFHTLGIAGDGLAPALTAAAHDDDGMVEAAFHTDHPLAAVMWHPERESAPRGDAMLVSALMDSVLA
jgi:gamma-glutamyl-gamma-aminobutyrate hydrolase PuuD